MFFLLVFCLWMISFTCALECEVSEQNPDPRTLLPRAINKSKIRRQTAVVEACYVIAALDFRTKQYFIYFSDSTTDTIKDTEHQSILSNTRLTFDRDPMVVGQNESFQSLLIYTCTSPSRCNKDVGHFFLLLVKILMKDDMFSVSPVQTLRQLILNSEEETNLNKPVRCFVPNSKEATECEQRLCFATITGPLKQSCVNDDGIMNGKVHLTMTIVARPPHQIGKLFPIISYTCNIDQCNSNDTINQVKDAIDVNPYDFFQLMTSMGIGDVLKRFIQELFIVPDMSSSSWKVM